MSNKEGHRSIEPSFDGLLEPTHAFNKPLFREGRTGLDVPNATLDHPLKLEVFRDLFNISRHRLVLLVCKDQEWGAREKTIILNEALELIPSLIEAHLISRVDDVDEGIDVLKMIPPVFANLLLTPHIPQFKFKPADGQLLNVVVFGGHVLHWYLLVFKRE